MAALVVHQVYGALIHPLRIGWDPALHLQCAHLITLGKVPYVDMFDVNPPLIWYLDTIPAFLHNLSGIPITQAFSFFLTLIIAYSASMSLYLFTRVKARSELIFAIPFVIGLVLFNFFLRFDFGQREDIFVLLYMPFFLLRWLRWQSKDGAGEEVVARPLSIIVGLLGGIGICLKPYFLIPALSVELYWLVQNTGLRRFKCFISTEALAAVAAAVLYALHFLVVPAQMRENYFGYLVPAFSLGYNFWDTALSNMFSPPDKRNVFYLMVAASVAALALKRKSSLFIPLVIFTLSSNIPYLLQFKGWAYHNQPVFAGSCILGYMVAGYLVFLAGMYLKEICRLPAALLIYAIPFLIAGAAIFDAVKDTEKVKADRQFSLELIGGQGRTPVSDVDSPFLSYFEKYFRKGDTAIFMSNGVTPGYPLLTQLSVPPGSRHLHCVILSVLHYIREIDPQTEKTRALLEHAQEVVDQYGEDIKARKPRLIFVQISPVETYLSPFNFEGEYLSDYEKIDEIANFKVFLRKRND